MNCCSTSNGASSFFFGGAPVFVFISTITCAVHYIGREKYDGLINGTSRAFISSSYIREESPILSLSWWGWRSCYESVVLGAPFTPAGSTAEAERRVAHSISCNITL